jgi:hypothetical protein
MPPTGPDGLHRRFLRGETASKAFEGIGLGLAVVDLGRGEDALKKALAVSPDGALDAIHLRDVDP